MQLLLVVVLNQEHATIPKENCTAMLPSGYYVIKAFIMITGAAAV